MMKWLKSQKIPIWVLSFSLCHMASFAADGVPIQIFTSEKVLRYDQKHLSPQRNKLVIGEWGRNSAEGALVQNIKIIDLSSTTILKELTFSSPDQKTGYLDHSTLCWDRRSENIFFTLTNESNIIYQWNIKSGQYVPIFKNSFPISRLAVSQDNDLIAYIEYVSDSAGKLKIHSFKNNKTIQVDADVDYVSPLWKDESTILFSRKDTIYAYYLGDNNKVAKVAQFDKVIFDIEIPSKNNLLAVLHKGLEVKRSDTETTFSSVKEIWHYSFATNRKEKIVSFRTGSAGLAITENDIIFPLSTSYEKSRLVIYNVPKKLFRQITSSHEKNDLPIFIRDDNKILFRGNNKEILLMRYED